MSPASKPPKHSENPPEKAAPNHQSQKGDNPRCSFSSESDEDLGTYDTPPERQLHGDHYDRFVNQNIWLTDANDWVWARNWVKRNDQTTNFQLRQDEKTLEWLEKLSQLRPDNIIDKLSHFDSDREIPLFESDIGDEYRLNPDMCSYGSLPQVWCPATLGKTSNSSPYAFQLKSRVPNANGEKDSMSSGLPNFVVPIGRLCVKTTARSNVPAFKDGPIHETTDFSVIVDLGQEAMPLWIVAPREQLEFRPLPSRPEYGLPLLPIFDGLMMGADNERYDVACIMSSIHQLDNRKPGAEPPSYKEACKLVCNTRAAIDPVCFMPHEAELKRFLHGEEIPKAAPPKTSHLLGIPGGISRLWAFLNWK